MDGDTQYLTFGELGLNELFIAFPEDGDNHGHGGYLIKHYIFRKRERDPNGDNAIRQMDLTRSSCPDQMRVIRVG
jgi:hypothetical protein